VVCGGSRASDARGGRSAYRGGNTPVGRIWMSRLQSVVVYFNRQPKPNAM